MVSMLGFGILVGSTVGALLVVAITEFILIARKKKPLGHYVNEFMVHYPWFAGVLAVVFGAMVAHFFLHITHG